MSQIFGHPGGGVLEARRFDSKCRPVTTEEPGARHVCSLLPTSVCSLVLTDGVKSNHSNKVLNLKFMTNEELEFVSEPWSAFI